VPQYQAILHQDGLHAHTNITRLTVALFQEWRGDALNVHQHEWINCGRTDGPCRLRVVLCLPLLTAKPHYKRGCLSFVHKGPRLEEEEKQCKFGSWTDE
jgi:hypothetical protein